MSDWWQASDEQLSLALGDIQSALNLSWARMLAIIAEADARGLAAAHGYRDTAEMLRGTQNVTLAHAKARVRAAAAIVPARDLAGQPLPAELPATADAVACAAISEDHVRVIQAALAALPPHLDMHREALEADLVEAACHLDPKAVADLGKRALAALDPDGPRPRDADPTRTRLAFVPRGDGFEARGWFAREDAAVLRTALSPLSAPVPANEHEPDVRSVAERQGDGLVELARRMLAVGDLPFEGGARPQVMVTVPLQVLESRLGTGLLGFADGTMAAPVSASDARRLACDAQVVPVVLSGRGEPLDVGRAQRTVPTGMRRALVARDNGCGFPGCEAPPQWTDAHHVVHWAEGGPTALDNLVLLCGRHHRVMHRGEWEVRISDGFPVFHPPPWIPGGPRSNPVHRPDLLGRVPERSAPRQQVRLAEFVGI